MIAKTLAQATENKINDQVEWLVIDCENGTPMDKAIERRQADSTFTQKIWDEIERRLKEELGTHDLGDVVEIKGIDYVIEYLGNFYPYGQLIGVKRINGRTPYSSIAFYSGDYSKPISLNF